MWNSTFEQLVRAQLRTPVDQPLGPDDPLAEHGMDSMGTVTLLVALEQEYGVVFPDELLVPDTFDTAGALWTVLSSLRAAAVGSP